MTMADTVNLDLLGKAWADVMSRKTGIAYSYRIKTAEELAKEKEQKKKVS
jgi:hypothetical protein